MWDGARVESDTSTFKRDTDERLQFDKSREGSLCQATVTPLFVPAVPRFPDCKRKVGNNLRPSQVELSTPLIDLCDFFIACILMLSGWVDNVPRDQTYRRFGFPRSCPPTRSSSRSSSSPSPSHQSWNHRSSIRPEVNLVLGHGGQGCLGLLGYTPTRDP